MPDRGAEDAPAIQHRKVHVQQNEVGRLRGNLAERLLAVVRQRRLETMPPRLSGLQALNAAAIILLALYFGQELFVPMALAVLLAFVLAPAVTLLRRAWLPTPLAVFVAVGLAAAAVAGVGTVVGNQGADLAAGLPRYRATIQDKVRSFAVGSEIVERLAASAQRVLTGSDAPASAGPLRQRDLPRRRRWRLRAWCCNRCWGRSRPRAWRPCS